MKQLNFKLLMIIGLLITAFNAVGNDRYINFDGQGIWTTELNTPAVSVFLKDSSVYAKISAQNSANNLPPIRLKRINSDLLNEHTENFIRIHDYNDDGWLDVAVLKSSGYGLSKLCYSVFEYQPDFYSYSPRVSKTICIN